jgi:DnaK suppressor protein
LKEVDVTPTKKAAATTLKKSATPKRAPAKKAAPAAKSATSNAKKAAPATKRPAPKKPTAVKKAPAAAKKKAPVKKTAAATKPAVSKKAPASSRSTVKAAPAKKAPAAGRKADVGAKGGSAPAAPKRPTVGPYAKEPKFLDEQRALLLEERGIYHGQAHDLRAEADSLALEREPGDVQFDEESGEGGTVTVDRERNLALSAQASAAVEEIDDAVRKIERKTYGACERCHQPIPKARLRALPFARLCVACKSGGLSRR